MLVLPSRPLGAEPAVSSRMLFSLIVLTLLFPAHRPLPHDRDLAAYLTLVEQYRGEASSRAVDEIARWETEEVLQVFKELPNSLRPYWDGLSVHVPQEQVTTLDKAREARKPTPLELLATAMMLHSEAARHADGAEIERQLDFARRLADLGEQLERSGKRVSLALPESDSRRQFSARWHVLAGTILLGSQYVSGATEHFDIARRLRPRDPVVLLAAGSLHELQAALLGAQRSRPELHARSGAGIMSSNEHLERARELYEQSLAADPQRLETRVRYARVLSLLGQHQNAVAEVSRVLEEPVTGNLRYLALMIAGSVDEARGQLADAAARYVTAGRLCRGCQSASLALSHARLRTGDRTAARDLVDGVLRSSVSVDPWWTYHRGQWDHVDQMLEDVRNAVPR